MIIQLGTVRATVLEATDEEHRLVAHELAIRNDQAFMRKAVGQQVDTHIRLYDRIDDTFPAGYVQQIVKLCKEEGLKVEVKDARVRPCQPIAPDLKWLRDYQREAVELAIKRVRGVIKAATGAGKTEIAIGIVESVPTSWLFLAHRDQLADQAAERYRLRTGLDAGTLAKPSQGHGLTVATFQGIWAAIRRGDKRVMGWLKSIGGVIVDECHVLPADTFRGVLNSCPAYWRIGVSATPLTRGDEKSIHILGCLAPVFYTITPRTLIDAGLLAEPVIRMVRHDESLPSTDPAGWELIGPPEPMTMRKASKAYQKSYDELIFKSQSRNRLIMTLAQKAQKPALVFVRLCKHGEALKRGLEKRGEKVEYVDGKDKTPVRKAAIRRLERGDTDILISNVVMNAGVDIPELRSVVIAAAGASVIEVIQRMGRGMRAVPGKTTFDVWDIWDEGDKFLERHAKERRAAYQLEDFKAEVVDP